MASPELFVRAEGEWVGESKLFLPWLPEGEQVFTSESNIRISTAPHQMYAFASYSWRHDDAEQTGDMVVTQRNDGVTAGWADTWHQHSFVMTMKGEPPTPNLVKFSGNYPDGEYKEWGWRIELELQGETLTLRMVNIFPDGKEEWAVDARYERKP